jgi:OOP family OmpA-OmpF porin
MTQSATLLIGTLLGAFFSFAAFAQESGAYLGGSLGQSKFTKWCDPSGAPPGSTLTACDDKDTGWKLFGGYQFNRYVAAEVSYTNWGEVSGAGTISGTPFSTTAETHSIGIAAVGTLPLGPAFSVFAKLGYMTTKQERNNAKFDDEEYFRGFGARYRLSRNWGVRAEWERANRLKAELLSIGAEFRF